MNAQSHPVSLENANALEHGLPGGVQASHKYPWLWSFQYSFLSSSNSLRPWWILMLFMGAENNFNILESTYHRQGCRHCFLIIANIQSAFDSSLHQNTLQLNFSSKNATHYLVVMRLLFRICDSKLDIFEFTVGWIKKAIWRCHLKLKEIVFFTICWQFMDRMID